MFKGSLVAMITPFKDDSIDWNAFDKLIEWHIDQGTQGLVVCGTTGESPVLTSEEHERILKRSVDVVKGRIPLIAGTGANATAKTVDTTRLALDIGIDAAMVVTPYYNKPSQEGLYQHYKTIAEAVSIPIILYNVPGRCAVDLETNTVARLAKISNIIALKDASADLTRPAALAKKVGADFIQLSGEDATVIDFLQQGGHGCISVTANVAPSLLAALHNAWEQGDIMGATHLNERLMPLHNAMFSEPSPAPAKYALSQMGLCANELRLPLVNATETCRKNIDGVLAELDILNISTQQQSHG